MLKTPKKALLCHSLHRSLRNSTSGSLCPHARPSHALKEPLNLRGHSGETMAPEIEAWVLDELNKGNEQAPRVWPVDNKPLQQHPRDLFL